MDLEEIAKENRGKCVIEGDIPSVTKSEPCWLGIDEAGRGPVLGPMVYGTCYSPVSKKVQLKEMGVDDSKVLTEAKREELFKIVDDAKDMIGWMVDVLSPNYISNCMLRRHKYNLNTLSHDTAIGLIQRVIDKGVNVTEVYVDTVGLPEKYQEKLKGIFPNIDITVEKKADATYAIVGAASICAKVARDHLVKDWRFIEGLDLGEGYNYGSGYPGDPATKKFLVDFMDPVFGFPQFVRFSWSTASTILDKEAVQVQWPDDDEEMPADLKGTKSITSFFQSKTEDPRAKKPAFFTDRCLKQCTNF